jgi:hypothetical protein
MQEFLQIFKEELSRRKRSNPRYSLRAYSRYLDIDPSLLCRAFITNTLPAGSCVKLLNKMPRPTSLEEKHSFLRTALSKSVENDFKKLSAGLTS